MNQRLLGLCAFLLLMQSCKILELNPRKELSDGFYTQRGKEGKSKVYVSVATNDVQIYPVSDGAQNKWMGVDTNSFAIYKSSVDADNAPQQLALYRMSFDIDLMTMPLKFRFPIKGVPPQLNTPFNGAVFFGMRNDHYKVKYKTNPLYRATRRTVHFGYSFGYFTGLGNTYMSTTTTNNIVQNSYYGVVWSNGIAGTIGFNSFTFGLALGFDMLLDKNRAIWAYQNKPWLALTIGLNLK